MSDLLVCKNCGEYMLGDGYTIIYHCIDAPAGEWEFDPPDSNPVYCEGYREDD